MKLVSVNVGKPRVVETARGDVLTSIFKEPVVGRRKVAHHNVQGDRQADLTVHGGPSKAVYSYAADHYPFWRTELGESELPYGAFGENLTIEGLDERHIGIGDLLAIGSARLRVTQPRMPCVKLAIRFGRTDMIKRFWKSERSGIYFSVEQPGELGAGDDVVVLERNFLQVSVTDVLKLFMRQTSDPDLLKRCLEAPLSGSWKEDIRERWMTS